MGEKDKTTFAKIRELATTNVEATLEHLVEMLTGQKEYHQLFEVLKMQARHRMGLALIYQPRGENLKPKQERQLESDLLAACRTVGELLVKNHQLREGWVYLQPLGDKKRMAELIGDYPVDEENLDEVIEVALLQQAAPGLGFALVLQHYGTCNAITSFDTSVHSLDRDARTQIAEQLADHLYLELKTSLGDFLAKQETKASTDASAEGPVDDASGAKVLDLVRQNKAVLAGAPPVVDATHLASTMRLGRWAQSAESLQRLCEMAEYGCQLDESYHFPGDPPFEKTHRDHLTYYRALVSGRIDSPEVKQAVEFLDKQSQASQGDAFNPVSDEVYVDLLYRLGLTEKAIAVSLQRVSPRAELSGVAPTIFQMAAEESHFQMLEEHYEKEGEVLGFAISLLAKSSGSER